MYVLLWSIVPEGVQFRLNSSKNPIRDLPFQPLSDDVHHSFSCRTNELSYISNDSPIICEISPCLSQTRLVEVEHHLGTVKDVNTLCTPSPFPHPRPHFKSN